jgi:cation transport protein ChaC
MTSAVFAYGSLIWRPGFPTIGATPGLLRGRHRAFCLYSHRYRGTPDRPGLVLGLDHGGACRGLVWHVDPAAWSEVRGYLWDREMVGHGYHQTWVRVATASGPMVALTFVVDRRHPQYAGGLDDEARARLIATSEGARGGNRAYLDATIAALDQLGIRDRHLDRLAARVAQLHAAGDHARPSVRSFL